MTVTNHMSKKFLHLIVLLLISGGVSAQILNIQKRNPKYDYRPIHFGFEIGMNFIDFKVDPIADLRQVPNLYSIETQARPGITLLLISDLRIGNHLNLRFTPGIAYTQRDVYYTLYEPNDDIFYETLKQVESTFIEFPILMKFKSVRVDNMRVYVLGGIKYMVDMASQERVDDPRLLRIQRNDYSFEVGAGMDFYFDYFKFSPQIKATYGVNNVLVPDGTIFTQGIQGLQTRAILISFCFE